MKKIKKASGFTLIEVIIATLVLSTGLVGMAGVQISSLKNNVSAYNRGQATQLSYDLSDKMRANTSSLNKYLTSNTSPDEAERQANCESAGAGCSPSDMAENDLFSWHQAIIQTLPAGEGEVTYTAPVYTITIKWDDNADGAVDASDAEFQMSFELI